MGIFIKKTISIMKLQQVKHIVIIAIIVIVVPIIILAFFRKRIFGFILKPEQKQYLDKLHRKAKFKLSKFVDRVEKETDYNVIITDSYRTFAEQQKEHLADPRNPEPGGSFHNFGFAIDINATNGTSYLRKASSKEAWEKTGIPQIAREMGIEWGGDYKSYYDPVHFGLESDYSISYLKDLALDQFGTSWENIRGNEIKIS